MVLDGDGLPHSVRYVKNGAEGKWWQAAKVNGQVHAGWRIIPPELLMKPDWAMIRSIEETNNKRKGAATNQANQLRHLLDAPSEHLWITFEEGCMWWCTVKDGAVINPHGMDQHNGNFWLVCDRRWSNRSIKEEKLLAIRDLPGVVTRVQGFMGTVAVPKFNHEIVRIIRDEKDLDAIEAANARAAYQRAVEQMVTRLTWKDFEELIDLILYRSGWMRISTLGGTLKDIDLAVENSAINEIAFVQVKAVADQALLNHYIERFSSQRDWYARMIFAVHTPKVNLTIPTNLPVHVWTGAQLAKSVVRLGLGEWVEKQLA